MVRRVFKTLFAVILCLLAAFGVSWLIYMPDSAERGAWRLETGGAVLHLTPLKATLFSESSHSCYEVISFPAHMKLVEMLEGASVGIKAEQLHLSLDGALDVQRFDRIAALPDTCTQVDPADATPRDVFDAVWTAMDEHYAFFDLHGVDWDARRALAPAPDAQMDDAAMAQMLLALTAGLDDGHVHFGTDAGGYSSPAQRPAWIPAGNSLNRDILRDIAAANAGTLLKQSDAAPISYGLRPDGVGYIMIKEMDVAVPVGSTSAAAMGKVFAQVLDDLAQASALVIDIRYNPGGSDTVSFGIASHFVDSPRGVFTKTTRNGDTQSNPFTAILHPYDSSPDQRPVVLLTSKLTGSAAEILTLAMRDGPQVTTQGEPTSGGLSDVMGFVLPNGWGLGLSNQTYLTPDGQLFEAVGIPPDVAVAFETPQFLAGRDPVLQAAFATANGLVE